jgi:DNA (cytosine-5)-methyltransferase 1
MALNISGFITQSLSYSPPFWSAALSLSITMKEFTNYARSASSSLFTELQWVRSWGDFIGQAERTNKSLGNLRARNYGSEIFPIAESLRGDSPPSRETREEAASGVANCLRARGNDPHRADTGNYIAHPVAPTLNAEFGSKLGLDNQHIDSGAGLFVQTANQPIAFDTTQITSPSNGSNPQPGDPCHPITRGGHAPAIALAGNTIGRKPENGGNGTGYDDTGSCYTLTNTDVHAVAYGIGGLPEVGHCLRSGASKADKIESSTYVKSAMKVRRLTPAECHSLQGFPRNFLHQVPGASDTQMYRALGNSMSVNAMSAIGRRIQMVDQIPALEIAA